MAVVARNEYLNNPALLRSGKKKGNITYPDAEFSSLTAKRQQEGGLAWTGPPLALSPVSPCLSFYCTSTSFPETHFQPRPSASCSQSDALGGRSKCFTVPPSTMAVCVVASRVTKSLLWDTTTTVPFQPCGNQGNPQKRRYQAELDRTRKNMRWAGTSSVFSSLSLSLSPSSMCQYSIPYPTLENGMESCILSFVVVVDLFYLTLIASTNESSVSASASEHHKRCHGYHSQREGGGGGVGDNKE